MRAILLTAVLCTLAGAATAGPVEQACNASNRQSVSRALCACIGNVADRTLSGGDQRKAAKFFRDPDAAQKARASDTRSSEAFWQRYANFGATAEAFCITE